MTFTAFRGRARNSRGLTLIELVVVLTILVALGGIVVPVVGNFFTRSHVATCTTNIPELSKLMIMKASENGAYPDGFQTGIASAAFTHGAISVASGDVVNNTLNGASGLQTHTLTADEVLALNGAGITTVYDHGVASDPTFEIDPTSRTLAAGQELVALTNEQAEAISLPIGTGTSTAIANQRYVWLGLGPECTLFGAVAMEAPAHFGDDPDRGPNDVFSRFGAIFQLADETGGALETAKFKRITYSIDGEVFETIDSHVQVFWEDTDN